ncbi:hypothetical protein [Amycolatopsis sp. NPDC021455]|uniref:hypothetical protein n=1 Tax=Amycolatopsis sp. NPDC021455 TaxID=3154901 RepID=UPI0034028017
MRVVRGRRRTALACSAVMVVSLLTGAFPASAQDPPVRPGPHELSRSALEGLLRRTSPQEVDASVRQARQAVTDQAARTPAATGSASVVLAEGLTAGGAADFVAKRGLDLISGEAKVSVAGEVYTLWFNDFERIEGTGAQKLERAVGKARLRNLQQANAAPAAEQAKLRELATADIRFYRLDVAATHSRLADLANDRSIAAVVPDTDDRKVTELRSRRAKIDAARKSGATAPPIRLESGDPAKSGTTPSTPVLTNSGQRCAWRPSDGALGCETAHWGKVSGDPVTDSGLARRQGQVAAGTTAPAASAANALTDSNAFTDCRAPSNNEGCPNDFTYSPRPQTSGSQSFAVLVDAYPTGYVTFYDCYLVWVPNNGGSENDGGYWQTVCYPYTYYTNAFTYGAAGWRSTWGAQTTTVAPNVTKPVSTLAFKASELKNCDVDQFGATATCDPSDQNAIYVPYPGIEDELLIDNPACTGGDRSGDSSDWDRGCFYPTLAQSNLPSPYLDTTFGDHPGDPYDLAIGSANPAAIAESSPYTNYAEFFSWGYNDMVGRRAWHAVSVDSRVSLSAACAYGNVIGQPDAFCYFPVDSVRVSEVAYFSPA